LKNRLKKKLKIQSKRRAFKIDHINDSFFLTGLAGVRRAGVRRVVFFCLDMFYFINRMRQSLIRT